MVIQSSIIIQHFKGLDLFAESLIFLPSWLNSGKRSLTRVTSSLTLEASSNSEAMPLSSCPVKRALVFALSIEIETENLVIPGQVLPVLESGQVPATGTASRKAAPSLPQESH